MIPSPKQEINMANQSNEQITDVLYQKLGGQWFAFSILDGDVFMSPVSDDRITEVKNNSTAIANIRPSNFEHEAT
jgi:hypothetical protein